MFTFDSKYSVHFFGTLQEEILSYRWGIDYSNSEDEIFVWLYLEEYI